jgi:serine/threonine protein kinase
MGEVYRAHDTKLGREVALKILPESVSADPERRARFAREARALAALNHPNIAQVHGLECHDAGERCVEAISESLLLPGVTLPTGSAAASSLAR